MAQIVQMTDDILAKCGVTPEFVHEAGKKRRIHSGSMHYYSGNYVLISVPCQFAVEQTKNGKIILEFFGDGALLKGEAVCTQKMPTVKINEAVLTSRVLPTKLRISRMLPEFKAILPFTMNADQNFCFAQAPGK